MMNGVVGNFGFADSFAGGVQAISDATIESKR